MLGNVNENITSFPDLMWNEKIVLGVIAAVIIVLGIYPKPIMDMAEPALKLILEQAIIK
jgi:NADH-quinone oxidoreductase subunit M